MSDKLTLDYKIEPQTNGSVKVGRAILRLNHTTGDLGCGECNLGKKAKWCKHIEYLVKEQQDYLLIGRPDTELTGTLIKVPIVPTLDVWAEVGIGDFHEATQSYKMELIVDSKTRHFIGFLQREEGRLAIRAILWAWFEGNVTASTLACKSKSHSFKQELEWNAHTGPNAKASEKFAEYWMVWYGGTCLACASDPSDFGDLVPDPSSNNVF